MHKARRRLPETVVPGEVSGPQRRPGRLGGFQEPGTRGLRLPQIGCDQAVARPRHDTTPGSGVGGGEKIGRRACLPPRTLRQSREKICRLVITCMPSDLLRGSRDGRADPAVVRQHHVARRAQPHSAFVHGVPRSSTCNRLPAPSLSAQCIPYEPARSPPCDTPQDHPDCPGCALSRDRGRRDMTLAANAEASCSSGCRAAYGSCYKKSQDRAKCQAQRQRCLESCIKSKR